MATKISIIVAMSLNRVIGYKNKIPWNIPEDLKRFAEITNNHTVIMGRKTYESIIEKLGFPLKNRKNVVLTRNKDYKASGCLVVDNFDDALKLSDGEEVFIIGGSEIYKLALPYAHKIYLTQIEENFEGDAFFPKFDKQKWEIVSKEKQKDKISYCFKIYKKKIFVNLNHSRTPEQISVMQKISKDSVCPFCMDFFMKYHTEPIIKDGKWWLLTTNFAPYEGTKFHFLLIYKHHSVKMSDLKPEAGIELLEFVSWVEKEYKINGGSFFMRFGETNLTGSSVNHLHAQIVVGNSSRLNPNHSSLKVKLGYK